MDYQVLINGAKHVTANIKKAVAIFTDSGKILYLNEEAYDIVGDRVINLEVLPGRYVENENFYDELHRTGTIFTHKALIKAGTETFKIRGMMHVLAEADEVQGRPLTYILIFDTRDERIFGSVTLENIVENSGFVAIHWVLDDSADGGWKAKYVSNTVNHFGYNRNDFYEGKIKWENLVYKDDLKNMNDTIKENLKNDQLEYTREYRIVTKQGNVVPIHDYCHLMIGEDGKLKSVEMVIFDMAMETKRNADLLFLERALIESRNVVVVWEFDANNMARNVRYVSNNAENLGVSAVGLRSGEKLIIDYIHPYDRERVTRVVAQYASKGYSSISQEYRIVNDEGDILWVKDEGSIITLPEGTKYVESIITDITDAKAKEEKLLTQKSILERKMKYIQDDEAFLSDMSVLDFVGKDSVQEIVKACSELTGTYQVIADLDGETIIFPEGPEENMSQFYDMFERSDYKKVYFDLNKQLRKTKEPVTVETEFGSITGLPLMLDEKHMATWIVCAFNAEEKVAAEKVISTLWVVCRFIADYIYNNTISEKQAYLTRESSEESRALVKRGKVVRDLLRRCNESNDEETISYVLRKAGEFLGVSSVGMYIYNREKIEPRLWCSYEASGVYAENRDDFLTSYTYFEPQREAFEKDGILKVDGEQIPVRFKRGFAGIGIRALVSVPVNTLTEDQQYLIFKENASDRKWTEDELSFINTVGAILRGFIQRIRSNVDITGVINSVKQFFDISREYIYIKDETGKIIYINPRLQTMVGSYSVGRKCNEVFRHEEFTNLTDIDGTENGKEMVNCAAYSRLFNRPMRLREMPLGNASDRKITAVILSPEN